jgi:hypothetical protein
VYRVAMLTDREHTNRDIGYVVMALWGRDFASLDNLKGLC